MSYWSLLLVAAGVLGVGYWLWKKGQATNRSAPTRGREDADDDLLHTGAMVGTAAYASTQFDRDDDDEPDWDDEEDQDPTDDDDEGATDDWDMGSDSGGDSGSDSGGSDGGGDGGD
ncbi:MAG: hypothetical protein MUC97_10435 [Bernardetiaceae bacterium]|jgi:hypothetical protein|nr:hypothetical protein [Bernardetiaceae bacterium]